MSKNVKNLTRTAVLLALLIVLQFATGKLVPPPAQQFVTGSCVNAVLAIGAWMLPLPFALALAIASPFLAFVLQIGPKLVQIIPAISVGNAVYVIVLNLLFAKKEQLYFKAVSGVIGAVLKFLTLYLLIVKWLCTVLPLPEPQVATFSTMFSWPQLVTALIGAAIALAIYPPLKKALKD